MTPKAPWPDDLDFSKEEFAELMTFVDAEREAHPQEVYPLPEETFAAFALTPYDDVKVVLLGQDPYPLPGDAMGLSFSVHAGRPLPASLRSINTMMELDGLEPLTSGDLTAWGEQGVLLLNTALTVVRSRAGSHLNQWKPFTQSVIELLSARERPMVFLMWGAKALWWERFIDTDRHQLVSAPHPAVRGTHPTAFHTSKSFSRVNAELTRFGEKPIDWEIPERDL